MSTYEAQGYEPDELVKLRMIAGLALPQWEPADGVPPVLEEIAAAKSLAVGQELVLDDSLQRNFLTIMRRILEKVPSGAVAPRWMSAEEAAVTVGDVVQKHAEAIRGLAARLGMIRSGGHEDVSRIDPGSAIFVVEGGANKTSVVRRGVAEDAMRKLYGGDISGRVLYQFGSDRIIPLERTNRTGAVIPNQEHATIRSLAPDLPADTSFTEFEATISTACADGYTIESDSSTDQETRLPDGMAQRVVLRHSDPSRPIIHAIRPVGKGLVDGLAAVLESEDYNGAQIVVATNGQYRPLKELLVDRWARRSPDPNRVILPTTVALGDEPGDVFPFAGGEILVPARPTEVYLHEIALWGQAFFKQ